MIDKLSWLLMVIQAYMIVAAAFWTAEYVGWFFTSVIFIGTLALAVFEVARENGET